MYNCKSSLTVKQGMTATVNIHLKCNISFGWTDRLMQNGRTFPCETNDEPTDETCCATTFQVYISSVA